MLRSAKLSNIHLFLFQILAFIQCIYMAWFAMIPALLLHWHLAYVGIFIGNYSWKCNRTHDGVHTLDTLWSGLFLWSGLRLKWTVLWSLHSAHSITGRSNETVCWIMRTRFAIVLTPVHFLFLPYSDHYNSQNMAAKPLLITSASRHVFKKILNTGCRINIILQLARNGWKADGPGEYFTQLFNRVNCNVHRCTACNTP